MLIRKLLSTSAFRFTLVYLLLFCASVSLLLGYVYWSTVGYMTSRTDAAVILEMEAFVDRYRRGGLASLIQSVRLRSRHPGDNIYLLIGPGGGILVGSLNVRSFSFDPGDNWIEFEHRDDEAELPETILGRARAIALPGGFHLLVGRNVKDQREIEELITAALAWSLGLTVLLGLAGGVLIGRNMLRRIDAVNRSIQDIMGGNFSRRLPVKAGARDELHHLSINVNAMLDRIETLMQGMREVSDDIAHDLRSPLNRMRARLEIGLMSQGEEAADERKRALEDVVAEVDEMLRLFEAMLAIRRLEARVDDEHWENLDLAALAHEVGELYAPAAEEKHMRIAFALEEPLMARGVRELLARALSNLIENAIAYGAPEREGEEGRIEIEGRREGNDVLLAARDWGRGIPEAERERVFHRFVRLESSRNSDGSGLGLSLARAVARRHGGSAWIEDGAPGCRVILRLPGEISAAQP